MGVREVRAVRSIEEGEEICLNYREEGTLTRQEWGASRMNQTGSRSRRYSHPGRSDGVASETISTFCVGAKRAAEVNKRWRRNS